MSKGRRSWRSARNRKRRPAYVPLTPMQRAFRDMGRTFARQGRQLSHMFASGGYVRHLEPIQILPVHDCHPHLRQLAEAQATFRNLITEAVGVPREFLIRSDEGRFEAELAARSRMVSAAIDRSVLRAIR